MMLWTGRNLHVEVLEQVMRVTDDDALVLPFLDAEPGSRNARAALGRLLCAERPTLVTGSPVMSLVTGEHLDPQWRTAHPVREDSLWANLQFLTSVYGPADAELDPY